jgi:Putative zinc-finger
MITSDQLAAFADGELSPEEAAEVVMHLADHPEDQALVDEIMAANAALARAFAAPMSEPVPEKLRALILGHGAETGNPVTTAPDGADTNVPSARILPFRRRFGALGGLALAASVAGLALFLPQSPLRQTPAVAVLEPGPLVPGSELHRAVAGQPNGQGIGLQGSELILLSSLPITGGHCREAELINRDSAVLTMALICHRGEDWVVEVALSEPLPDAAATGFVPAGGVETGALDLWLDRMGAGMALSPEEEAEAIAKGWPAP